MTLALRDRWIVCISSIDWDFLWQGHQEIMSRLAASGNKVAFIENTGVRSAHVSDAPRIMARFSHWLGETATRPRQPIEGINLISPLLLPFPRSRVATVVNERVLIPYMARRLSALRVQDPIILTYLPTPNALSLIELIRTERSVVVYYCAADFHELSDLRERLSASEGFLVRSADLVFVAGEDFVRRFASLNPEIHEFKFGVNLQVFDPVRAVDPPAELRALPRPIVGYTGGLHRHVDFDLLAQLAQAFPHGSVVLVGPDQAASQVLSRLPNVHRLGIRPLSELPAIVGSFDVGLIPYLRTTYTETVCPTKLFEYLAMNVPVVAPDLRELRKLRLPTFALRLAATSADFVTGVRDLLLDRPEGVHGLRNLALSHDWSILVERMADLIAAAAARRAASA